MKRIITITLLAIFTMQVNLAVAQETGNVGPNFPKIDSSPMDLALYRNQEGQAIARVIYSRPQKRNREVFGHLVPHGEVWRTGANETTELTLYKPLRVANVVVDAGTYSVYTIPKDKEWTVILNKRIHTWGALEYTDKEDMVRINVPVRKSPTSIESFSMTFEPNEEGANLLMGWDDRYVVVPFKTINQ